VDHHTYLIEVGGCHVPDPPAFITNALFDLLQQMLFNFGGRYPLGDGNQVFDG
jgi:hypothetical protein